MTDQDYSKDAGSQQATIAGVVVLGLLKALQRARAEPAPLCRAVGLDVASLEDPTVRVSTGLVTRLLGLAEHRADDPWIGLHAGERLEPRSALFYLMQSSPKFGESLRRLQRFSGLLLDTLSLAVRTDRAFVSVAFDPGDAVFSASRHAMEYLLMATSSVMRHAVGATCRFSEVHFRHCRTGGHDEAERAFGCPVYFGQPKNLGFFPLSTLWAVPRFANRAVAEHVEKFVVTLCARTTEDTAITESAKRAIRSLLSSGVRARSVSVARRLGMTSRTLQRKLAGDGTTFRELRDTTLWGTVEVLLSNPSPKIEVIALSVGYSEVAAFSKAFRRWKGCSPTRFREIALAQSRGTPRAVAKRQGSN